MAALEETERLEKEGVMQDQERQTKKRKKAQLEQGGGSDCEAEQ